MLERARRFVGRHLDGALLSVLVLLAVGALLPLLPAGPARAEDRSVNDLKAVALSDVGLGERLMALEALKKAGSSAALDALEEVAKKGDLPVAAASCAQLGRVNTSTAKSKLKGLLESTSLEVKVRMAAAACIAEHWKDRGDLSYLESKCADKDELKAHFSEIKSRVFNQ